MLLALPVVVAYYPPMTDLPFHEAAIGLLRHWGDPTMEPPGLYFLNLGEPNQLFHVLGWALSWVVSTRWAVKILVAATVASLPVAAARFARHVGASPVSALLVAPMALGWLFSWGLIANLVGLSALLCVLPVVDRLAETPGPRLALHALGAAVLLYFAHLAMLFVFAGIALGLALLRPWSRRSPWTLTAVAAPAAMTIAQLRWQAHLMTPATGAVGRLWQPLPAKLVGLAGMVVPASETPVRLVMCGLCVLALALFYGLRAEERRGRAPFATLRARLLAYRWEIVAVTGIAAYLAFPVSLGTATFVAQRWFPPAFAVAVVVGAPRDVWVRRARVARFAALALPLATLFTVLPSFTDSDRQHRYLDSLVAYIEPGSAVAELDLGPGDPLRNYSLGPAYGRVMAERGGRLVYAFTDSPVSPVMIRPEVQWNESLWRIGYNTWRFRPAHDFKLFRYAIVRTQDARLAWEATLATSAEAEPVAEAGEWLLLRSKLPVVPVVSPEPPMETPPPESIDERVLALRSALRDPAEPAPH
ncbi:MAG TPA: hypothetical protein VF765_25300 [Polyangiaceae bacterium]